MSVLLLYIAAAGGDQSGIHTLEFNPDQGSLRDQAFAPLPGAGYLVFSKDGTRMYATGSGKAKYEDGGEVAAFSVAADGGLTYLNSQPSGGASTCHLAVSDNFVYCANYSSASFAEIKLAVDGSLDRRTKLLRHEGRSVHPTRQAAPHPHFVGVTPDGRYVTVVDLGCEGIYLYPLDPAKGISEAPFSFGKSAPGDGPRHLVFNAAGTLAYVANELANSVSVFGYVDGTLSHRQTATSLPANFTGQNTVAAIRLSPDGKTLFVSNRGHDSIALYDVQASGLVEASGFVGARGMGPRDFALFGDASWMAVTNEKSDNVAILAAPRDGGTGWESILSLPISARPICVLPALPK